ncbi:MAG: hypothetical protein P8Y79_05480 [Ignavibacteriaceae bacterium]
MKPLVCIYCEGNDTKLAVVSQEKNGEKVKVIRTAAVSVSATSTDIEADATGFQLEEDSLQLEGLEGEPTSLQPKVDDSAIGEIKKALTGLNLNNYSFIPVLTEPSIYYHLYEGSRSAKSQKLKEAIINEILETKNVSVDKDGIDFTELSDKSLLSVFIVGEVACINMINAVAHQNGKRFYKIPTVKSSDISLSYYVAKKKKFFPDDHSLIVYIGKEYSKLIFLHGRKLKHIGTTLDIGTSNLHTYDVYFSKILLEMENGGIPSLDNIIVCGEDDSENLILSFYGTFPEANVSRLEFDDLELSDIDEETRANFSSFSIPIAVAIDYYDEQNQVHQGINLLPKSVREEQKFFQFSWHSYAVLPLLFLVAFWVTQKSLTNTNEINKLDDQIKVKTALMKQNQQVLAQIAQLEDKISGFDQTQAILDSATVGTGVWYQVLQDIASFTSKKKSIWLTKLTRSDPQTVLAEGYSLSRYALTDFAYSVESATLNSMFYEALRDRSAYKFNLTFNISTYPKDK